MHLILEILNLNAPCRIYIYFSWFQPCVFMDPKISQCSVANVNDTTAPPKSFTFDGVYYTDSTTEAIYNEIAYPLVEGVLEGLHTVN